MRGNAKQQRPVRDPRLDKPQLGWDMQPNTVIIACGAFVAGVVLLHFMGSFLR